jgi:formylglycine-generating enzyme required for sulfatase activity
MKVKNTLLSLLGAGLIYTGCGEEFSSKSSSSKTDVVNASVDTAVDTYDTGIDTFKRDIVKADTAYDTSVDTHEVKVDTHLDAVKDVLGLEAEVNEAYTIETTVDTYEVGDAEEEINADVYQPVFCPDLDKDGFFGIIAAGGECYAPSGKDGDCDDNDKLIHPGALELCDGIDNGCNGFTDEDLPNQSYYTGAAGTLGVGVCTGGIKSCLNGTWEITTPEVTPSLIELCDGKDNNCNTFVDEGQQTSTFYFDNDGDGFGDLTKSIVGCTAVDGSVYSNGVKVLNYVNKDGDCDDGNKSVYQGAPELCDGIDNDCNSSADDNAVFLEYFFDGDQDGYGSGEAIKSCAPLSLGGYVTKNGDCDDQNQNINPDIPEACNGIDDNCNGSTDDGLEEMVACGKNGNGTQKKSCTNGVYVIDPNCTDPDECVKDEEKTCSGGGPLKCTLEEGIYKFTPSGSEDTGKYPDGIDNDCDGQTDENYFVLVPAGTYIAGCNYPAECNYAGNPVHEVSTPGFYISTFEFTKKQAGKSGNLPETDVTQTEAENNCIFMGGRLPTADEWEITAKGGKAENIYPWGLMYPSCNLTNFWYCEATEQKVGSYPLDKSSFGNYDMGGNVSEWTSTLKGLSGVAKGGNFQDTPEYVLVYQERLQNPDQDDPTIGFRCVLDKIN